MEDIIWQDPDKDRRESLKRTYSGNSIAADNSSSDSFADQFIHSKKREEELLNEQYWQQTYSERYIQADQNRRSVPDFDTEFHGGAHQQEDAVNSDEEPIFGYNGTQVDNRRIASEWRFFDLKNKKQTGDLYKKMLYYDKKKSCKIFNFVSSRSREGTSTIVANLVVYINNQSTEKKILVVDTNLQSPNLHRIFNIHKDSYGLMDIFNNSVGTREAIVPISSNIFLLCCGNGNDNINDNIEQEKFLKLLNYYRKKFDYIVIDCPPVLSSSDALSIAPSADLTFLIIESAKVQRPVAEKAKTLLQNDECQIGGVILNRVQQVIPNWIYKFI